MRSTTAVLSLALIAAGAPAIAAPVSSSKIFARDEELDARAVGLGALGKELGKGLLTGGAFSGLAALADKFLSPDDPAAPATKREIGQRELSDDEIELLKRAVGLGALGKELGKGLLTGGAFSGLAALADKFLDPAAPAATKREISQRELSDDEFELLKRAVGLGALGKELGKGLLTGGAFSGLAALADNFLGDDAPATKRELTDDEELLRRGIGSILGKLVGATEDSLSSVLKNGLTNGIAAGVGISAGDAALGNNNSKRELDERSIITSLAKLAEGEAGDAIKKGLVNGVGSAIGGTALGALLSGNGQKRELDERSIITSLGKLVEGEAGDAIKKGLVNGVGSAIGGTALGALLSGNSQKRDLDERSILTSLGKLVEGEAGDAIKKGLVNGLGSAVGGTALGALLSGDSNNKRDLSADDEATLLALLSSPTLERREPLGAIGKGLLGTGVGLVGSGLAQDAIDEIKSLFNRDLSSVEMESLFKREPEPLGAIGKGLLGTGVGLAGSGLAQEAIDAIKGLFDRELSINELD